MPARLRLMRRNLAATFAETKKPENKNRITVNRAAASIYLIKEPKVGYGTCLQEHGGSYGSFRTVKKTNVDSATQ